MKNWKLEERVVQDLVIISEMEKGLINKKKVFEIVQWMILAFKIEE